MHYKVETLLAMVHSLITMAILTVHTNLYIKHVEVISVKYGKRKC